MDDSVTSETLLHGEAASTARVRTRVGPLLLVEGRDVALEVERCGERSFTPHPGTQQHQTRLAVHALMLCQAPPVSKRLGAYIAANTHLVQLPPVRQIISPCLPGERAPRLCARIAFVHLFVTF